MKVNLGLMYGKLNKVEETFNRYHSLLTKRKAKEIPYNISNSKSLKLKNSFCNNCLIANAGHNLGNCNLPDTHIKVEG